MIQEWVNQTDAISCNTRRSSDGTTTVDTTNICQTFMANSQQSMFLIFSKVFIIEKNVQSRHATAPAGHTNGASQTLALRILVPRRATVCEALFV
jgi:hypothetical protein